MKRGNAALVTAGVLTVAAGGLWIGTKGLPWRSSSREAELTLSATKAAAPWTMAQLRELIDAVRSAEQEGLRPADYKFSELEAAAASGRAAPRVDAIATAAAAALAHDYAAGRVKNRHRFNWYIDYAGPDRAELAARITEARERGQLGSWLAGLLPTSPDYRSLRAALANTSRDDGQRRDRIIANLERWRWLPQDFGTGDQLYVNLPTYQLQVISNGEVTQTYRAVIGATDMPTPVLSATVRQVIANPDWIVPASIVRRSHLTPGSSSRYIFKTRPNGTLRVRQKPGPGNALGRVKIEFPNAHAIYFHDTPSKSLFGANARAFSHGCVRVQDIEALALSLVARPDRFTTALAGDKTRSFSPARVWKANIIYLTLVAAADGSLSDVGDPYKMDEKLAAALQGRKPPRPALAPNPATPSAMVSPRPARTIPMPEPSPEVDQRAPEPANDDVEAAPAAGNQQQP